MPGDVQHTIADISRALAAKHIPPTHDWMIAFAQSIRPNTPIQALQRTAEFRLLGTDIVTSLQSSTQSTFPSGITNPNVKELRIPGPVPVQVLDIEDIGRSRWSQVEAIEMEERGETRKGHEVIRVVQDEEDNSDPNPPPTNANSPSGPHKILLQDAKGNKVYAFELETVNGVDVSMAIGSKLVLKDFLVARGVIMLTARGTTVLGGKLDAWDKKWREDRKKVLKEKAGWSENPAA
ncbi:hypothetical protein M409DRAFT_51540 [Zasmidium cellare ATCC 36951]|uniref:RecQ-mediated genome instability protein 1 n=1 Tax=Zasmidium cellare ATCC 36951 TaxID=1080233 RepID=A0A6A6CXI6_ZASCE|nr:uncharacterized protein M409DRAFT_51540 [Zasmidium cellare ATCC 36951]KAF2170509.1 hypothetical protein M409DRAFT_51540 [Zasmidium cellare ATCC 36951]